MSTQHPTQRNDIFSIEQATAARDKAIDQVDDNAERLWRASALAAVQSIARRMPFFTSDDVWLLAPCATHEPRAMGGVMRRAQRLGLCRPTNTTQLSARVACHRRPIRVWQSLLYRAPAGQAGSV